MSRATRLSVVLFAVLGICAASASTWTHYQLVRDASYASFCDVSETVSCSSAYQSAYGELFGVPVAILGVLWFVVVFGLLVVERVSRSARENVPGYLLAWATAGLSMILYLAYGAFVVLKTVCLMCVTTYVAVIGIFLVAGAATRYPMSTLPTRLMRDVRTALTSPAALAALIVFGLGAGSAIAFFPREADRALQSGLTVTFEPAAQPTSSVVDQGPPAFAEAVEVGQPGATSLTAAQRDEIKRWYEAQQSAIVPVDGGGAAVVIVKFNDYQCPPCMQTWSDYTPIFKKFEQQRPGMVKYIQKDFPLEPECNPNVSQPVHPSSCDAAVAVRLARTRSAAKGDALEAWIYAHQATITPEQVRAKARELGGVTDFEARWASTVEAIKADAALGGLLQVTSTPTFFINGRRISGGVPPLFLEGIIEHALQAAGR